MVVIIIQPRWVFYRHSPGFSLDMPFVKLFLLFDSENGLHTFLLKKNASGFSSDIIQKLLLIEVYTIFFLVNIITLF